VLAIVCSTTALVPGAQMRVVPVDELEGHVALGLVLRHLGNTGTLMMATAHPDDEDNGLLVMLNRGQGYRTALVTATRGNGGQNEIGPEIFEALGVVRTEELAALHRFDGAEQYFTRAVDFGFSFSIEETFEKWGRDEILADFVRLIRMIRPDVITGLSPTGAGGGQHHQASAILAREAFSAAADPAKYPDQIKEGLRPWQPKKFYFSRGFGGPGEPAQVPATGLSINLAAFDRLLGRTYAEIGTEARSMHKSQGMAQLLSLPGPASTGYELVESTVPAGTARAETALFDGVDTSISGLVQFAGRRPPRELTDGLSAIAAFVQNAHRRFDGEGDEATLQPLEAGLRAVRALRGALRGMSLDEAGRFEIDVRLRQKEREFQQAILLAASVRVEALADDGVVVPGQPVRVSVLIANRGAADVALKQVRLEGFDADAPCTLTLVTAGDGGGPGGRGRRAAPPAAAAAPVSFLRKDQVARCEPTVRVPANARIGQPYWHRAGDAGRYTFDADAPFGLPYRPTPFYVQVTVAMAGGEEVIQGLPVQYRYEGNIFSGEKRSDLLVVPALSVRLSPEIAIMPSHTPATPRTRASAGQARSAPTAPQTARSAPPPRSTTPVAPTGSVERDVRVTVVNSTKDAASSAVTLDLPQGWTSTPGSQAVTFTREDEAQTVRFQVRPAPNTASGEYRIGAAAAFQNSSFTRGYQVIEYPHIRRQHIYRPATTILKIIDVKTAPNLTVGYIMGVGDEVPAAIEQLGAKVELLGPDDLAWGNLSRFSTIVTGVRAYERRGDLRANNSRLLEYVRSGGTLIVQYNKFEFNEAQYGPYPAKVTSDRVTDENAPVTLLVPGDPVFTTPNRIGERAWENWVQERGLYFLSDHDSRYQDLLSLHDPSTYNRGEKRGALVSARYGKGRWVYVGLGLWRELPAGVDGAYQLLANLISLNYR
jgi:LmbE family N-acetylglucosaminyl deacetylase